MDNQGQSVSVMGSTCQWCQVPALRAGFGALGYTHADDWRAPSTLLTFVGNGPYDQYIEAAPPNPLILNVLDIATQNANVNEYISLYRAQLPKAAHITAISRFTQWQLKTLCQLDSTVVYYPMKDVRATGARIYPEVKVLICGRVNDPNKRVRAAISILIKAGYDEKDVAIVGPEHTGWGVYHGVVDDVKLNDLYNSAEWVMMLSVVEGIGLPAVEAACVGAIPILAPDLTTFDELWSASPMGQIYRTFTSTGAVVAFMRYLDDRPEEKAVMRAEMIRYANGALRPLFDRVEVARRILALVGRA